MAAASDIVRFANEPPTAQEVANEVSKLTGLNVRVDQIDTGEIEKRIFFEAIPREKITLKAFREADNAGHTHLLVLFWTSPGKTLHFATRIALESMGGTGNLISEKTRRKYGQNIATDQLVRRHRWEQIREKFLWRPITYLLAGPFLAIIWMLCMMNEVELKWRKRHP